MEMTNGGSRAPSKFFFLPVFFLFTLLITGATITTTMKETRSNRNDEWGLKSTW